MSVKWIKRILFAMVVVFALFYLVTRPSDAADAVKTAFATAWHVATSIGTFFIALAA